MSESERLLLLTPSTFVDPRTPWVHPYTRDEKLLSSAMWVSFGMTSSMLHAIALIMTLGVLPFGLSMCSACATIHEVQKPEIQRVEMAVVKVEPPPPPPPPPPPVVDDRGAKKRRFAMRAPPQEIAEVSGLLALIGSAPDAPNAIFGSDVVDSAILSSLDSIGEERGVVGGVEGGVVGGQVGGTSGDIGMIGGERKRENAGPTIQKLVRAHQDALRQCVDEKDGNPLSFRVKVADHKVTDVLGEPCAKRVLLGQDTEAPDGLHRTRFVVADPEVERVTDLKEVVP